MGGAGGDEAKHHFGGKTGKASRRKQSEKVRRYVSFWSHAQKGRLRAFHTLQAHFNYAECLPIFHLKLFCI